MRNFKEYYNVLKEELAVSRFLIDSFVGIHFLFTIIGFLLDKSALLLTCGRAKHAIPTLQ